MKASLPDSAFPWFCAAALLCSAGTLLAQDPAAPPPPPSTAPAPSAEAPAAPANIVASEELSVAAELPGKEAKASAARSAGADLPKAFPLSRYAALLEKSPFAVATAAPEAAPPAENFATNFVITGLAKNRGADGKEVHTVFVRSRDLSTRLVLTGDKPSDEGISVVSVEEAAVAAKSVVILKKGSETGRVEFDHAALAASAGAAPQPTGAPQPGKPGVPGSKSPTTSATRPAIPRPGMSGVPRPGASLNPPAAAPAGGGSPQGAAASGGQELRRRVRPIQGAPGATPEPP